MFNYMKRTKKEIDQAFDTAFTALLLLLLPRAMSHIVSAGCFVRWTKKEGAAALLGDELSDYQLTAVYRCLVIISDKTPNVIVYEELPAEFGGPRAISIAYEGPTTPPEKSVFTGQLNYKGIGQTPPLKDLPPSDPDTQWPKNPDDPEFSDDWDDDTPIW
jgi:hypothetical protein